MNYFVETGRITRKVVSAFAAIALAAFCSPTSKNLHGSPTPVQQHQKQFDHKGGTEFCVLAKTPTKVCTRKGTAQQSVQLLYSGSDVSLHSPDLSARLLCAALIHSHIARENVTFRERAPPV